MIQIFNLVLTNHNKGYFMRKLIESCCFIIQYSKIFMFLNGTPLHFIPFCVMLTSSLLSKVSQVPKHSSALVAKWTKCTSALSARVLSECPSAWAPSDSFLIAQRNFRLVLTLALNEKITLKCSLRIQRRLISGIVICCYRLGYFIYFKIAALFF